MKESPHFRTLQRCPGCLAKGEHHTIIKTATKLYCDFCGWEKKLKEPKNKIPEEKRLKIAQAYKDGWTYARIQRELKTSHTAVTQIAREEGLLGRKHGKVK